MYVFVSCVYFVLMILTEGGAGTMILTCFITEDWFCSVMLITWISCQVCMCACVLWGWNHGLLILLAIYEIEWINEMHHACNMFCLTAVMHAFGIRTTVNGKSTCWNSNSRSRFTGTTFYLDNSTEFIRSPKWRVFVIFQLISELANWFELGRTV